MTFVLVGGMGVQLSTLLVAPCSHNNAQHTPHRGAHDSY